MLNRGLTVLNILIFNCFIVELFFCFGLVFKVGGTCQSINARNGVFRGFNPCYLL